ncbi:DHHC palmitoyltransferase-domain-containing protein [Chaetomium tenue]|uniref:DHHC palmitoyltransferase-domain-containing protein n=1 Tax=Chaetomium tenue TaxID=1854479 RepID=A0ACB7PRA6_9PEZI|nr:DHHC palmitoyltransferase-domain-containing protein [Chaetomium globosum]
MTSPRTGPTTRGLHRLYIPAVCALIAFQGYFSQYLFSADPDLAPGPLTRRESITFNTLLACVWVTYYFACTTDPGRYHFPPSSSSPPQPSSSTTTGTTTATNNRHPSPPNPNPNSTPTPNTPNNPTRRHCKKCHHPKPLRSHHCRHCARCIPKMDHHCPWTGTCVSLQTFPPFLRFLLYTNLALWYLTSLLYQRAAAVWSARHLPAYLGPSAGGLVGLVGLAAVNGATVMALGLMLYTTVRGWVWNCTLIEEWEVERHEAGDGGVFWGDDDATMRAALGRIEFPYDLGVFANMAQAMGSRNPLLWFLPVFGSGPVVDNRTPGKGVGWEWEENGFNDLPGLWPPPDPEKMRQERRGGWPAAGLQRDEGYDAYQTQEEVKAAFARRQEEDFLRRQQGRARQAHQSSEIMAELEELDGDDDHSDGYEVVGKPLWTNSDGDRLWDYGVDEDLEEEFIPARGDDEDVPLTELIRRRKVLTREDDV